MNNLLEFVTLRSEYRPKNFELPSEYEQVDTREINAYWRIRTTLLNVKPDDEHPLYSQWIELALEGKIDLKKETYSTVRYFDETPYEEWAVEKLIELRQPVQILRLSSHRINLSDIKTVFVKRVEELQGVTIPLCDILALRLAEGFDKVDEVSQLLSTQPLGFISTLHDSLITLLKLTSEEQMDDDALLLARNILDWLPRLSFQTSSSERFMSPISFIAIARGEFDYPAELLPELPLLLERTLDMLINSGKLKKAGDLLIFNRLLDLDRTILEVEGEKPLLLAAAENVVKRTIAKGLKISQEAVDGFNKNFTNLAKSYIRIKNEDFITTIVTPGSKSSWLVNASESRKNIREKGGNFRRTLASRRWAGLIPDTEQ